MRMTRMGMVMAVLFGTAGFIRPAFAHDDGACRDDMQKFCGNMQPGGGAIANCMKSHEADLSAGCKQKMTEHREKFEAKMKEVKEACAADLKQFCANVTPGQGREFACLHAYDDKISAGCKAAMPKPGMHRGMGMMHQGAKGAQGGDQDEHDEEPQEGAPPTK